jgi:hypothetical protein
VTATGADAMSALLHVFCAMQTESSTSQCWGPSTSAHAQQIHFSDRHSIVKASGWLQAARPLSEVWRLLISRGGAGSSTSKASLPLQIVQLDLDAVAH